MGSSATVSYCTEDVFQGVGQFVIQPVAEMARGNWIIFRVNLAQESHQINKFFKKVRSSHCYKEQEPSCLSKQRAGTGNQFGNIIIEITLNLKPLNHGYKKLNVNFL